MPARASSQDYVFTHRGPSDGHRRVEYDLRRLNAWVVRRVPHRRHGGLWHRNFRHYPDLCLALPRVDLMDVSTGVDGLAEAPHDHVAAHRLRCRRGWTAREELDL